MYYITVVCLNNCRYSESAKELLKKKGIKSKIIQVQYNDKDKYKSNAISTFPQVYLKKENSKGSLLLGGYSDLKKALTITQGKNINNVTKKFQKAFPEWSKKAIYRFVEIINK